MKREFEKPAKQRSAWVDGSFDTQISPHDEGFLLGTGVFETVGEFGGALPLWTAHLQRLARNAEAVGIPCAPPSALHAAALELLARESDDIVRITLTAGVEGRPTWCLTSRRRAGSREVQLHVVPAQIPLAEIKCTSRLAYTLAARTAVEHGADDALLVSATQRVLETTTGNVFFWKGDVLHTPGLGESLLPGVARDSLLGELDGSVRVEESDYVVSELAASEAMFVTNAVYGPRPAALGDTRPAPLKDVVVAAWQRATRSAT